MFSIYRVKVAVVAGFVLTVALISGSSDRQTVGAASNGPSPSHTGAPAEDTCVSCHADFGEPNLGTGSVVINGVPANYSPGQVISVTVTTAQSDATIYGFQLTAIDSTGIKAGTFSLPAQTPAEMKILPANQNPLNRQYVEHTSDGLVPTMFGSKSWTFTWTAPAESVGKIDFYVAGNAANSDGSSSGDYIYTASVSTNPAAVPSHSITGQVTIESTGLPLRNTRLTLTGNGISQTVGVDNFGFYRFTDIPANATKYRIRIESKRYRFTLRDVLVDQNLADVNFAGKQ